MFQVLDRERTLARPGFNRWPVFKAWTLFR